MTSKHHWRQREHIMSEFSRRWLIIRLYAIIKRLSLYDIFITFSILNNFVSTLYANLNLILRGRICAAKIFFETNALCVGAHAVLTKQYKYTQNLNTVYKDNNFFLWNYFFPTLIAFNMFSQIILKWIADYVNYTK